MTGSSNGTSSSNTTLSGPALNAIVWEAFATDPETATVSASVETASDEQYWAILAIILQGVVVSMVFTHAIDYYDHFWNKDRNIWLILVGVGLVLTTSVRPPCKPHTAGCSWE